MSRRLFICFAIATLALMQGCTPEVKPVPVEAAIQAAETLNPDAQGRPSPVVVRTYQLRSASVFETADFFALFDAEQATLGADLISREEKQVKPGERLAYSTELDPAARYVGAIAAFRDIEKAKWRSLATAPDKESVSLVIELESTSVSLSVQ